MWYEYDWIVTLGGFLAFFTAYGIGANDVANAFATSVGAKTLSISQAVIIAGIFEFAGAVLVGSQVTDTIRKNIADQEEFDDDPEVLMYGMICVLAATGIWLTLACFMELPVSTTHSVIGGMLGMALATRGSCAVVWYEYNDESSALKKFTGVAPVIFSWMISPFLSGCFAVILFCSVRRLILRHEDSERRAFLFFPVLVGLTVVINVYFIVYKGFGRKIQYKGEKMKLKNILGNWSHLVAWTVGLISALVVAIIVVPYLQDKIIQKRQQRGQFQDVETGTRSFLCRRSRHKNGPLEVIHEQGIISRVTNRVINHDVHAVARLDNTVRRIHNVTEKFDRDTEEAFKYLQVFTAMCDSFAHGANDVANSIGPFTAIYLIYRNGSSSNKATVPVWILVLGGTGIVIGLATYGYNIIRAIGVKLVKVTASRGFSIELGSAIVIIIGSQYGIPLSTTYCQVGATVGVGLLEGKQGVNTTLLLKVVGGWLVTLLVVGSMSALFVAQGVYAPSVSNLATLTHYERGFINSMIALNQSGINISGLHLDAEIEQFERCKTDDSQEQIDLLQQLATAVAKNCPA
eukprot:g5274.t1